MGGLLLSLSTQWNNLYNGNAKKSLKPFVYFNFSRLVSFFILGGVLGLLGSFISISLKFSTLISLLVSVVMLIIGLQMLNVSWFRRFKINSSKSLTRYVSNESNFQGKYMPLMVGALTFFVPCGFTLIAQTNAVISGTFLNGALMLSAFALGTLPILALISFSSVKLHANPKISKKFNLFAGMLITFFAVYTINAHLNVLGLPSLSDISGKLGQNYGKEVFAKQDGEVQYLQMEARDFQYSPPVVNLKANVLTKWQIYNSGVVGCAQAMYAPGLYKDVIYLKAGLNEVEFTPTKVGTYKISCSMGMVPPVVVNVY